MSDDEYALLTAVRTNMADNLPRLVYADWLEQTGDRWNSLRAELIRCQVELDRREPGRKSGNGWFSPAEVNYGTAEAIREKELLEIYGCDLSRDLVELLLPPGLRPLIDYGYEGWRGGTSWTWQRGFINKLCLPSKTFLAHAGEIFSTRHAFERVYLADKHMGLADLEDGSVHSVWVNERDAKDAINSRFVVPSGENEIPDVLFRLLPPQLNSDLPKSVYETPDIIEGDEALSAACLQFGTCAMRTKARS